MKYTLYFLIFLSFISKGQALRDTNFKHWYTPGVPSLQMRPVREATKWVVSFSLEPKDTAINAMDLQLQWEVRNSINDKDGRAVSPDSVEITSSGKKKMTGKVTVSLSSGLQYLVGKVILSQSAKALVYYTTLTKTYPETRVITSNGEPIVERYVKVASPLLIVAGERYYISHYDDNFPTAPLAFSEALGKVPKLMKVDSTFSVNGNESFQLNENGLYLVQQDTSAAEGISFRAEEDYPRFTKLKSLSAPMIYICTNQEFERIQMANGDKKAFDKVILSITKDSERAKRLIRSYFKRVEYANEFFTSYKEGWKTDRGMIYIIFGPPDEVFRFTDREVWNYKNEDFKVDFNFARSPSLFDPHNFVLVRDKKYKEMWYEVIDLWRNARF